MSLRFGYVVFALLAFTYDMSGQSDASKQLLYPGGISVRYGTGSFALVDHYISPERYSGVLPYFALGWTRTHNRYIYKLDFAFRQSDAFKNNNVTSDVLSFKLSQGFLYPLKPVNLLHKELGLWIGPTTDIFYFENNPDIAVSGFDYTNSFATLISLGFRGDGIYPLSGRFAIESSLQFTMLSLGMRAVDSEEEDQSGTKLLSPASGLNASFNLGIQYNLFKWLSLGLSYRFDLIRITAWEELLSAGNSAFIELHFNF